MNQLSLEKEKYYKLPPGLAIQDITQKIIQDPSVPPELKKPLANGERRIDIFKYSSEKEDVAGYLALAYSAKPAQQFIFLRIAEEVFRVLDNQ